MKKLLNTLLLLLFLNSYLIAQSDSNHPEAIRAAKAINEMLIEEYDDNFYSQHLIRASVVNNIVITMYFPVPQFMELGDPEYTDNLVDPEHIETVQWQVYKTLIEYEIDCSKIDYIICWPHNSVINALGWKKGPWHIPGSKYNELLPQELSQEELEAALEGIYAPKEVIKIRKLEARNRDYKLHWKPTIQSSDRMSIESALIEK